MSALSLKSGEAITLVELDGDKLTLASPVPSPPGSTLLCLVQVDGALVGDFQVKVSRCRKFAALFHIDGRLRNAAREVRAALAAERPAT